MNIKLTLLVLLCSRFASTLKPNGKSVSAIFLQAQISDTINQLEWLLHQLVNILSEMTDSIENDPTLLENKNFRIILAQVIRRIDYILEHFDNVGQVILTNNVMNELNRINCVRIRLANSINYINPKNHFDDSQCMPIQTSSTTTPSTMVNNGEIVPLLVEIVTLLVQINKKLNTITQLMPGSGINGGNEIMTTHTPMSTMGTTIGWGELITDYINSNPTTNPQPENTVTTYSPEIPMMGTTSYPNNGENTNWEDTVNEMINQMTETMSTIAPSRPFDINQCMNSILLVIQKMRNQISANKNLFMMKQ